MWELMKSDITGQSLILLAATAATASTVYRLSIQLTLSRTLSRGTNFILIWRIGLWRCWRIGLWRCWRIGLWRCWPIVTWHYDAESNSESNCGADEYDCDYDQDGVWLPLALGILECQPENENINKHYQPVFALSEIPIAHSNLPLL